MMQVHRFVPKILLLAGMCAGPERPFTGPELARIAHKRCPIADRNAG